MSGSLSRDADGTAGAAPAPDAAAVALDAEDEKLIVLARGARARAGAAEGAAVRDQDGRTYAAATVALRSLQLTAAQAAVAAAVASGAHELEALVVVGDASVIDADSLAAAAELGSAVILLAGTDGTVRSRFGR